MSSSRIDRAKIAAKRPVGIDLFAGAGGLSLGFEQAGFDIAAAIEIDPVHCSVHEFNFPDCAVVCTDATKTTGEKIREAAGLNGIQIDVVFGGAPCQGFSLIGHRALDDPRNGLLLEFMRLTEELDARYFVLENVKGLTIGKHRGLLDELIEAFDKKGYSVLAPYRVLNAADFGVPQDRRRLFLMGAKKGLPLPKYPAAMNGPRTTVWQAIGDLPDPEGYGQLVESDTVSNAKFAKASEYARALRGLANDAGDFSYPRRWDLKRLTSSMRTDHTALSKRRFKKTKHGETEPVSRFLKLDPDGVCNTLRAGTGSERGAFTSPRPIHPYSPRCITVREAARLHSYPDWFRFHGTKWHGFRQIGNSVPPRLGRAVAAEVIRSMSIEAERPSGTVELEGEDLLWMTMSEAAQRYGVSGAVVGRRLRRNEKRSSAAA
jgi:DNA (cytosine-5)-methyltransferase 1